MRLIPRRDIELVSSEPWWQRPALGWVVDEANDALRLAVAALATAGSTCWITYGTLLGLVREGRLLPLDSDIDIAVLAGADAARIKAAMAAAGLSLVEEEFGPRGTSKMKFGFGQVVVDIFMVHPGTPLWTDTALLGKGSLVRSTHPPVTVEQRLLGGHELPVPTDAEAYLVHLYGADWRRPVTQWHWYFSPPNAEVLVYWCDLFWFGQRWFGFHKGRSRARARARAEAKKNAAKA